MTIDKRNITEALQKEGGEEGDGRTQGQPGRW